MTLGCASAPVLTMNAPQAMLGRRLTASACVLTPSRLVLNTSSLTLTRVAAFPAKNHSSAAQLASSGTKTFAVVNVHQKNAAPTAYGCLILTASANARNCPNHVRRTTR